MSVIFENRHARRRRISLVAACMAFNFGLSFLTPAAAVVRPSPVAAASIELIGTDGRKEMIGATELATLPRETLAIDIHGERHVFSGPTLAAVLARVGAPTGAALRGQALAIVALATAIDGYQVALSLGEIDPALHMNRIILADQDNGAALSAADGPFRLVVEGDKRPARSARSVVRIVLIRLK